MGCLDGRGRRVNWRELFKKYMRTVGDHEGVYFLYQNEWSKEEWDAIDKAFDEMESENPV